MANFYGFSHQQLMEMQADTFHQYWLAITAIEAQDMLKQMQIADYPHLKKEDRKKVYNSIHKQAYPVKPSKEGKMLTSEDIANFLNGAING